MSDGIEEAVNRLSHDAKNRIIKWLVAAFVLNLGISGSGVIRTDKFGRSDFEVEKGQILRECERRDASLQREIDAVKKDDHHMLELISDAVAHVHRHDAEAGKWMDRIRANEGSILFLKRVLRVEHSEN